MQTGSEEAALFGGMMQYFLEASFIFLDCTVQCVFAWLQHRSLRKQSGLAEWLTSDCK